MKNQPSRSKRDVRQFPLDHLKPGGRHQQSTGPTETTSGPLNDRGAEPAEPKTPGGGAADAARGKATRSPAEVATRPHLEGSEQGPM